MAKITLTDTYVLYRLVKRLITPFEKWNAFKTGVIDKDGNIVIPESDRSKEQRDSFTMVDLFVLHLKKLLGKIPLGKTNVASYAAALMLLREDKKVLSYGKKDFLENLEKYMEEATLYEDMPANNASSGAVAGLDNNPPVNLKKKNKKRPFVVKDMIRRKLPQIAESGSVPSVNQKRPENGSEWLNNLKRLRSQNKQSENPTPQAQSSATHSNVTSIPRGSDGLRHEGTKRDIDNDRDDVDVRRMQNDALQASFHRHNSNKSRNPEQEKRYQAVRKEMVVRGYSSHIHDPQKPWNFNAQTSKVDLSHADDWETRPHNLDKKPDTPKYTDKNVHNGNEQKKPNYHDDGYVSGLISRYNDLKKNPNKSEEQQKKYKELRDEIVKNGKYGKHI